jgi:hypothetical protein
VLEALPAKRGASNRPRIEARYDLFENGKPVGAFVYDPGRQRADIRLDGAAYSGASPRPHGSERHYQAALRLLLGRPKPASNPFELVDARGSLVARAEGRGFRRAIVAGGQSFALRRRSPFSRRFDLYRGAERLAIGSVGQRGLFSRALVSDLPGELPPVLPAFLMALLLDMTFAYRGQLASYGG